jgi:hypothetical protein
MDESSTEGLIENSSPEGEDSRELTGSMSENRVIWERDLSMTAARTVSTSIAPTSTLAVELVSGSMPGVPTGEHRSTCKESSAVGGTNRKTLNQKMLIAVEEHQGREWGYLRSVCNNLVPLAPGKMVFSAGKMSGELKSLRYRPSIGKRSNVAKKIDILSRKTIRLFDLGATSKGI